MVITLENGKEYVVVAETDESVIIRPVDGRGYRQLKKTDYYKIKDTN